MAKKKSATRTTNVSPAAVAQLRKLVDEVQEQLPATVSTIESLVERVDALEKKMNAPSINRSLRLDEMERVVVGDRELDTLELRMMCEEVEKRHDLKGTALNPSKEFLEDLMLSLNGTYELELTSRYEAYAIWNQCVANLQMVKTSFFVKQMSQPAME